MHVKYFARTSAGTIRWFAAAAGLAGSLMIPLSASADHQGNGAVEILASAAVAYVVIDAVGGFDNDRDRRHKRHGHRDVRHVNHRHRYDHHRDRRHWTRHGHRRYDRHGHHHNYRSHARKHRVDHRRGSRHARHHRRDNHFRYRAYH